MLDSLLAVFQDRLEAMLTGRAVIAYLRGSARMVEWGRTKTTDRPIYFEGPPMQEAINYASKHGAKLVTGMAEETKQQLAQVISDGIKEKRGIPGLARDIRNQFEEMTKLRSQIIARTETADALEQSFMDRSKDIGVTGKEWITTDPCPICEEFGDMEPVPLDYEYVSTVSDVRVERPPAHPNCMCSLAPVMLTTTKEGGEGSGNFGHQGRSSSK